MANCHGYVNLSNESPLDKRRYEDSQHEALTIYSTEKHNGIIPPRTATLFTCTPTSERQQKGSATQQAVARSATTWRAVPRLARSARPLLTSTKPLTAQNPTQAYHTRRQAEYTATPHIHLLGSRGAVNKPRRGQTGIQDACDEIEVIKVGHMDNPRPGWSASLHTRARQHAHTARAPRQGEVKRDEDV